MFLQYTFANTLSPTEDIFRRAVGDIKTELGALTGTTRPSVQNRQLVDELAKKIENELTLEGISLEVMVEHLNATTGSLADFKAFQKANTSFGQKIENVITLGLAPLALTDIEQKKAQRFARDVNRQIFVDVINATLFDRETTVTFDQLEKANESMIRAINKSQATSRTKKILLQKLAEAKTKAESRVGERPEVGPLSLNRSDIAQPNLNNIGARTTGLN